MEIHSRYFDVHSATLSVDARFVGLRRFLHERPVASGAFGIALTALSMFVLAAVFGRRIMTHVVRLLTPLFAMLLNYIFVRIRFQYREIVAMPNANADNSPALGSNRGEGVVDNRYSIDNVLG